MYNTSLDAIDISHQGNGGLKSRATASFPLWKIIELKEKGEEKTGVECCGGGRKDFFSVCSVSTGSSTDEELAC